jgi:hypothetical protein
MEKPPPARHGDFSGSTEGTSDGGGDEPSPVTKVIAGRSLSRFWGVGLRLGALSFSKWQMPQPTPRNPYQPATGSNRSRKVTFSFPVKPWCLASGLYCSRTWGGLCVEEPTLSVVGVEENPRIRDLRPAHDPEWTSGRRAHLSGIGSQGTETTKSFPSI